MEDVSIKSYTEKQLTNSYIKIKKFNILVAQLFYYYKYMGKPHVHQWIGHMFINL